MRLLAFGDTHIKPSGKSPSYGRLELPKNTDVVVTVGDVVHRTGEDDVAAGREFLTALSDFGVPVYSVPGNHDPLEGHRDLVEDVPGTAVLHDRSISIGDADLVGWGCEAFDIGPEVKSRSYESLDPRNVDGDRRHAADRNARRLENALNDYIRDELDDHGVADRLELDATERSTLAEQLAELTRSFDHLSDLLEEADPPTVVLTHAPPYGTELDRHHSVGEREADLDGLHVGSIALKLALRNHRPAVALSGHSHRREYEVIGRSSEPVHALNLGYRGIATVDYETATGGFRYDRHND